MPAEGLRGHRAGRAAARGCGRVKLRGHLDQVRVGVRDRVQVRVRVRVRVQAAGPP